MSGATRSPPPCLFNCLLIGIYFICKYSITSLKANQFCLASEQQKSFCEAPRYSLSQVPGAVRPYVDLLLECSEWLASVETDKLARSSLLLLLLLLHRLVEQGIAHQSSAHSCSRYAYVLQLQLFVFLFSYVLRSLLQRACRGFLTAVGSNV